MQRRPTTKTLVASATFVIHGVTASRLLPANQAALRLKEQPDFIASACFGFELHGSGHLHGWVVAPRGLSRPGGAGLDDVRAVGCGAGGLAGGVDLLEESSEA